MNIVFPFMFLSVVFLTCEFILIIVRDCAVESWRKLSILRQHSYIYWQTPYSSAITNTGLLMYSLVNCGLDEVSASFSYAVLAQIYERKPFLSLMPTYNYLWTLVIKLTGMSSRFLFARLYTFFFFLPFQVFKFFVRLTPNCHF